MSVNIKCLPVFTVLLRCMKIDLITKLLVVKKS